VCDFYTKNMMADLKKITEDKNTSEEDRVIRALDYIKKVPCICRWQVFTSRFCLRFAFRLHACMSSRTSIPFTEHVLEYLNVSSAFIRTSKLCICVHAH
jgi:hypothetical protein